MGKALYREYRSTSFDEVIGQDHVTTTLKNSLASGSIAHAYLLTGPRGVGKTSIARILAHEANDLPYEKDGSHLDIIEIDAASNRRIDEIRNLREKVHIAPTSAKYKVYIIDEVHMLTREAFNALLKTLEEPPAHVIFILATTEVHKLPETIVSRCITFTFRTINNEDIVKHLKYIAKSEKLNITDEALELLALYGEGSFRDSISLLDQIRSIHNKKIDREAIELTLGLAADQTLNSIINAITSGDPQKLNSALHEAYRHGASEANLAKQLSNLIRNDLLGPRQLLPTNQAMQLLKDLLDVPSSPKPRARLELSLMEQIFNSESSESFSVNIEKANTKESVPEAETPPTSATPVVKKEAKKKYEETQDKKEDPDKMNDDKKQAAKPDAVVKVDSDLWNNVLKELKVKNNTLYSIARMAETELRDKTLRLTFKFPFHFKQVSQSKNRSIINDIINELGHSHLVVDVQLSEKISAKSSNQSDDAAMTNITNIFGSGEVIES